MSALNRRFERKSSALKKLSDQGIKIDIVKDDITKDSNLILQQKLI